MPTGSAGEDGVTVQDLQEILRGDASRISLLNGVPQSDLVALFGRVRDRQVTGAAVFHVLSDLRGRRIAQAQAGEWASFVMRGYVRGHVGSVKALHIAYEPAFQDAIAEIVLRMEQIGDMIDGHLGSDEIDKLMRVLK